VRILKDLAAHDRWALQEAGGVELWKVGFNTEGTEVGGREKAPRKDEAASGLGCDVNMGYGSRNSYHLSIELLFTG
jgi:hypothetical protein